MGQAILDLLTKAVVCKRGTPGGISVTTTDSVLCMSFVTNKNVPLIVANICLSTCRAMAPAVSSKQNKRC